MAKKAKKENSRRRQQKRRTQRGDLCARTGGRGFVEAESGEDFGAETVQFKEKRVMLYPWMVGMYGGRGGGDEGDGGGD